MSMSAIIRAVAGGPQKTRAEGTKPEDEMEDDTITEDASEEDAPEEDAVDDAPETDAEDDAPETDAEEDEEAPAAASQSAANAAVAAKARKAERARIGAIMGDPAADANPKLAAHLAFQTGMSTEKALATLQAGGEPAKSGNLASRMAGANQPRLGGAANSQAKDPETRRVAARASYLANLSNPKK